MLGDVLLSSGFITYLGSYSPEIRTEMISKWKNMNENKAVQGSKNFNFIDFIGNPEKIDKWNRDGLPSDQFTI